MSTLKDHDDSARAASMRGSSRKPQPPAKHVRPPEDAPAFDLFEIAVGLTRSYARLLKETRHE